MRSFGGISPELLLPPVDRARPALRVCVLPGRGCDSGGVRRYGYGSLRHRFQAAMVVHGCRVVQPPTADPITSSSAGLQVGACTARRPEVCAGAGEIDGLEGSGGDRHT